MEEDNLRTQLAHVRAWLLDTGPIVARIDESDPAHREVTFAIDRAPGALFTTSAVITEAMFFASATPEGPASLLQFLELSGTQIYDACQPLELMAEVNLMRKYVDNPMDFADASLVHLAAVLQVYSILTIDRRGFSVFRTATGKRFRLVLDEPA